MQFDLYNSSPNESQTVRSFYGLNRTRHTAAGEAAETVNMSSREYPCAAPRPKRELCHTAEGEISAVCAPDSSVTKSMTGFTGIAGGAFYYNGEKKSGHTVLSAAYDWEIARLGSIYVMNGYSSECSPKSALYSYSADTDEFSEGGVTMKNLIVTSGYDSDGSYLKTFRYGFDEVYNYSVKVGEVTIKNSDFFDEYGGRILSSENIFEKNFSVGDEVTIEGFPSKDESVGQLWLYNGNSETIIPQKIIGYESNNTLDSDSVISLSSVSKYSIIKAVVKSFKTTTVSVSGMQCPVHYIYFELTNKSGDSVSFDNMNDSSHYCSGVTVSKRKRTFDHIAAYHNRLWGTTPSGNMIYASASDDIFSFSSEDILAKLAARLTSDTPGCFTALCSSGYELIAFKEDTMTIVYGSNASNYSTAVIYGAGCIDGKSIAVTPNGIIFLGYGGFYIFSADAPQLISKKLNTEYASAVSGYDSVRYYACAVRRDGVRELLVYDTSAGIWLCEDDADVKGFFSFRGGFYMAVGDEILSVSSDNSDDVSWSFTLAKTAAFNKYAVNEIWIRAELSDGAEITVETSADGGEFTAHASFSSSGAHVFRCPIRAVMTECRQWRIKGRGTAVIYAVELKTAKGGRRYREFDT